MSHEGDQSGLKRIQACSSARTSCRSEGELRDQGGLKLHCDPADIRRAHVVREDFALKAD